MLEAGVRAPSFELKSAAGGKRFRSRISLAKGRRCWRFTRSVARCASSLSRISSGWLPELSGCRLSASRRMTGSATKGFNQRFGVTFPTLLDQAKENYPASNAFGITIVPSLFLVENRTAGSAARVQRIFETRLEPSATRRREAFQADDNVPEWKAG